MAHPTPLPNSCRAQSRGHLGSRSDSEIEKRDSSSARAGAERSPARKQMFDGSCRMARDGQSAPEKAHAPCSTRYT